MSGSVSAVDLAPTLGIAVFGLLIALVPFAWAWRQSRGQGAAARLRALAVLTLVLSFDLVLLGAYTRLSDSGLGCPDWPGCYGQASPLGAATPIAAAASALPSGPVTLSKAWIEMAHRYAATSIGVLTLVLAVASTWAWRRGRTTVGPGLALATLLWICLQGAFGALTVTLRLSPAIVSMHLLGGMGLLALLAFQAERLASAPRVVGRGTRLGLIAVALLVVVQIALGAWVSSNYAVLACRDLPTCQGQWWPSMDFATAFDLRRTLGRTFSGDYLAFPALTAIHVAHRLAAGIVVPALGLLAWHLLRGPEAGRRFGLALVAVLLWQVSSGAGTVLLGWPLLLALAHTAGSALLVVILATLLARSRTVRLATPARPAARMAAAF
ncbi:MAG: COX15/CtaA family protein [Pseudomonadota bacterium]|nr:COX15/CtaA family protein [Pseudomonadota bacterium]